MADSNHAASGSEPAPGVRRRGRRALRLLVWLIAPLVLVAAAALAVLAVDPQLVSRAIAQQVLPAASERIGHPVTVERIGFSWFPPRARLEGLAIGSGPAAAAAAPGAAPGAPSPPPLLSAREAVAYPEVWPLLRSRGKDVRLRTVEVRSPVVELSRDARGRWNFQRPPAGPGEKPPAPSGRIYEVGELRIRGGTLRVRDGAAPGAPVAVALRDLDLDARNLAPNSTVDFQLAAAFAGAGQNLKLSARIDSSATPASILGSAALEGASLEALQALMPASVASAITAGTLDVRVGMRTVGGAWELQGQVRTTDLALRGQPAELRSAVAGTIPPANPRAARLRLDGLRVLGPGLDLGGDVEVQPSPLQLRFALSGQRLDLNALLGATPRARAAAGAPEAAGAAAPRAGAAPAVPPELQRQIRVARAQGTVAIDQVRAGSLQASGVQAEALLDGGRLTLSRARAHLYGGELVADGSTADLAADPPTWSLQAQLSGVDLGGALQQVSAAGHPPLQGSMEAGIDLHGAGLAWSVLREALTGTGQLGLQNGVFEGLDLDAAIAQPLAQGLQLAGRAPQAHALRRAAAPTPLGDLSAHLTVSQGEIHLPDLAFATEAGRVQLAGAVGLDGRVALDGTVAVTPDFVAQLADGGWRPPAPIPVAVQLGGTLQRPQLRVGSPQQVAQALVGSQNPAAAARNKAQELGRRLGRHLRGFPGAP